MRKNKKSWSLFLAICLFAAYFPLVKVQAEERVRLENLAVSLVVDVSGSMGQTDPEGLRETAAKMFIDLLSPEDAIGVITFDENVRTAVPFQKVESTANKNLMKNALTGNLLPAGDTDYVKAMESALTQLEEVENEARKVILFVTDGIPDPDPARREEPGYMDNYMNGLWSLTGRAAEEKIPIYTVGFGDIDPAILERMSLETLGAATITEDPGTLAEVFFGIVESLKNRSPLLEEEFVLSEEKTISFEMDPYISQTTLLLTQNTDNYQVDVTGPGGVGITEGVALYKERGYTLLTLNQKEEEQVGTWSVKLTPAPGETAAPAMKAFGSTDFFFKLWMEEPVMNAVHPMNEPLRLSVYSSTPIPETASLEAVITKNGVKSRTPIGLTLENDVYVGTFEDTKDHGFYEVEVLLKEDGKTIATAGSAFSVKNVPVITSDYFETSALEILDSSRIIRSSLSSGGVNLIPGRDLLLEEYALHLTYEDGEEVLYVFNDDGEEASGDLRAGDGLYSTRVSFEKEGKAHLQIGFRGSYKGEPFVQEKELGEVNIGILKEISVSSASSQVSVKSGESALLEIIVKNASIFPETLTFTLEDEKGEILNPVHEIDAQEKKRIFLRYQPHESRKEESVPLSIAVSGLREGRTISGNPIIVEVNVVSFLGGLLQNVSPYRSVLLGLLLFLFIGLLLFYLLGRVFYKVLVMPKHLVSGSLHYKKDRMSLEEEGALHLTDKKKKEVIISFVKEEEGDFYLPAKGSDYKMLLLKKAEDPSKKFIEGYKALFGKEESPRLRIQVTQPGVLNFDGTILTKRMLYDGNVFETADYIFWYEEEEGRSKTKAKNLLKESENDGGSKK
ncbi:vWA domain-containing protein [Proteiniclasticum ruminis]|uniref:von Willebrand factor type A domain-containing protein n=1 Tax=Proteiniclasticum ruminis TaxID=398199 RepID=A0A1G8RC59_9CLOT|nr:vWA domain-containing protein [Proteiniclasticum ruminis]SDJ14115.1 von Willebrand factor type A domain-containing protein [Proteiniclasticum ruminis]